jgi:hypothetical protein
MEIPLCQDGRLLLQEWADIRVLCFLLPQLQSSKAIQKLPPITTLPLACALHTCTPFDTCGAMQPLNPNGTTTATSQTVHVCVLLCSYPRRTHTTATAAAACWWQCSSSPSEWHGQWSSLRHHAGSNESTLCVFYFCYSQNSKDETTTLSLHV